MKKIHKTTFLHQNTKSMKQNIALILTKNNIFLY